MSRKHDILISSAVLIAVAPVYLLMALLITIESHASPFVGVTRIGNNGKPFTRYLFRTTTGTSLVQTTRIGRFLKTTGLEELPTFYNVLIGNMALHGTALLR